MALAILYKSLCRSRRYHVERTYQVSVFASNGRGRIFEATNRYMLLISAVFTVSTVFAMSAEGKDTFQYPVLVFLVANIVQILLQKKKGFCRMIDLTCIVLPGATLFLLRLHTSHPSLFDVVIVVVGCFAFLRRQSTAFGIRASSTYSNSYGELLAVFCLVPNAPGTEISSPVSSGNVVLTGSTGVGFQVGIHVVVVGPSRDQPLGSSFRSLLRGSVAPHYHESQHLFRDFSHFIRSERIDLHQHVQEQRVRTLVSFH